MCLSIPGKVEKVEGNTARVSVGGTLIDTNISLIDNVKPGEYILIHSGFALEKIDAAEAQQTLELFREFEELNKKMDEDEKEYRTPNKE
jgi:hydrogenase expression/formation protein HypC